FESGFDGINNIYALEPTSRKIYRLTAARFGAFQPAWSAGGKQLLYADYQANGYRMASLPADSLLREETPFESPARFSLAETISQQEGFTLEKTAALPAIDLQARPYAKASHLFHIHSWAPFYYNVDELVRGGSSNFTSALKPGATLISQNALNTAITQAGWYYNRGDHHAKLDFLYMGWFPVIHLNVDYGGKAYDMRWGKNDDNQLMLYSLRGGRKLVEASLRAYAPLNLTRNHYYSGIQPSISYYFTNHRYQQYGGESMAHYQYMLSEIRLYHYRRMAQRDILPRWGFQLNLQYLNMPFNSANFGSLYAARLTTYWPGVGPNHSLMLRAAFQYQPGIGKPLYITKQLIEAPRGYDYSYHTYRQAGFKADYAFPLLSPDFSLGSLAYVQRLRANLFYDLTYNQPVAQSGWAARSSLGGEFLFDWNALRFTFPLTTGLRVIRPLSPADIQTELMFSISF
ncbi:MAG: hypothetical protein LBR26_09670, partial [Prevotella sp.]|nr:hypothetical protein [Prevotella sp.]